MPGRARFVRNAILVLVAAIAVYLIGNSAVALWDRDEPRYAQASRQMVQSGDWVVIRFLDDLRTKKPPLIYWCQAAAMKVLGDNEFAARLPSTIAITSVVVITGLAVGRAVGARRAMWTVLVLSTSLMMIFSAKICLTDGVLLLWTTIGQVCLYAIYRGRASWPVVIVFWIAAGLGALTKGSNLAVHAFTLIVLAAFDVSRGRQASDAWGARQRSGEPTVGWSGRRLLFVTIAGPWAVLRHLFFHSPRAWLAAISWWRRLHPIVGLLLFAAVVAPWVLMVRHREPEFLPAMFGNVGKHVRSSAEGHGSPPGFYVATIWGFFLPWSLLLPMSLGFAWRHRRLAPIRFALAGVVGPWLFCETMWSKLPHYLLPAYPPLAFLAADAIVRCLRGQYHDFDRPAFFKGLGVWAIAVVGLVCFPASAIFFFRDAPRGATAIVVATAVLYVACAFMLHRAGRRAAGLWTTGLGMFVLCAVVYGVYLPRAEYLRTSSHVARVLKAHDVRSADQVLMLDYKEPSLAFYQNGAFREHSNTVLTDGFLDAAPTWLVVTRDVWDHSKTQASARDRLEVVDTFKGLDIADGMRPVEVMVVRKKEGR